MLGVHELCLEKKLAVQLATSEGRCWFMCNAHLNLTPLSLNKRLTSGRDSFLMAGLMYLF